jgi:hypothetical protein
VFIANYEFSLPRSSRAAVEVQHAGERSFVVRLSGRRRAALARPRRRCSAKERTSTITSPTTRLALLILCGLLLLGAAACGGGATVESEVTTATVGQQLIGLKKALDSGAINQKEYERERKKIPDKK